MIATYEISPLAEPEFEDILNYSFEKFGKDQMLEYREQLKRCLDQLAANSALCRNIQLEGRNLRFLHCQKHYIFAIEREKQPLLIIAILHERMDLVNRVKSRLDLK